VREAGALREFGNAGQPLDMSQLAGCGNGFGIVGIIDGSLAVSADVKDFVVLFEQKGFRLFLQIKSRVI
jgi:hypothetical protein